MEDYDYTPIYLTKNKEPWFPVMGEIHYSRYPEKYWREALLKMKAGGIQIVSTYVIWIHHEEIENNWDFSGNKNLQKFTKICKECGLSLFLRIGPWCHGEVRNGGFPDWLLKKDFEPRSNNTLYFNEVKKFYKKIYEQVKDFFNCNDGPIIGIQIENEFGHCGGLSGKEGEKHIRYLTSLARNIGFNVPFYTATGWGGAVTADLIPVMGGYVEAPWDQRITEIEPSGNYLFSYERNDHNIGNDFGFGEDLTFDINKYPYLTAELGGGLQVTVKRRPVALSFDIGALTLVKLGSGVNLLGYYMYHGGTNPKGKLTFLQESKETGSLNDLPEFSYDFRAPIREFGQISETYKELKKFTLFTADFGKELCKMKAFISKENPQKVADFEHLRFSWRYLKEKDGKCRGYLFVNNYIRRYKAGEYKNIKLQLPIFDSKDTICFRFPQIKNEDYFFLPFNMPVGDSCIQTAYVTPFCILRNIRPVYFFYRTSISEYYNESELINYEKDKKPSTADIIIITKQEVLNAYKIKLDKEYLFISDSTIYYDNKTLYFKSKKKLSFKCFPALPKIFNNLIKKEDLNGFYNYELNKTEEELPLTVKFCEIKRDEQKVIYEVMVPEWRVDKTIDDCFLNVFFEGNSAKLFIDNQYVDDTLFIGKDYPWVIGLKRFYENTKIGKKKNICIEVSSLRKDEKVFLENWPEIEHDYICKITNIKAELEYLYIYET